MTTTYYIQTKHCECCGRADKVSMGVSAIGWKFLFYTDEEHKNAASWLIELLEGDATIYDEYEAEIPITDFAHLIAAKRDAKSTAGDGCYGERFTTDGDFDYTSHNNSVD